MVGGAAMCAERIHSSLIAQGIDSKIITLQGEGENVVQIQPDPLYNWSRYWLIQKFQVLLNYIGVWPKFEMYKTRIDKAKQGRHIFFTVPVTNYQSLANHPLIKEADIVHLHWISNMVDFPTFFRSVKKPIVWTMHDLNPGLGGFHILKAKEQADKEYLQIERKFVEIKRKALRKRTNVHLVAISREMYDFAQSNEVLRGHDTTVINNGVNEREFCIFDKRQARAELGINEQAVVFCFVSFSLSDPNKNLRGIIQSLERLHNPNVVLLCLGNYNEKFAANIPIVYTGLVSDKEYQSKCYSASDYLIMASYQEAFSQTPLEAMACGTPVIASPVSGASELINERNGVVCRDFSNEAIEEGIRKAMEIRYDAEEIRRDVVERFSYQKITREYIDLYNRLLQNNA